MLWRVLFGVVEDVVWCCEGCCLVLWRMWFGVVEGVVEGGVVEDVMVDVVLHWVFPVLNRIVQVFHGIF